MDRRQKVGSVRLMAGLAINVCLWFVYSGLARWSTVEREFRLNLIGGCLSAVTLVLVVPVFWKGAPWQAPLALLFMVLPGFMIYSVLTYVLTHR
jgi:hypothetical protein